MMWNDQLEKKTAENLNIPNPFTQLQEEWAEEIAAREAEKEEIREAAKKKHKLSPEAMKKLKEYKPL